MKNSSLSGLSQSEANQRLQKFGRNQLAQPQRITFFGILKQEIVEPMILMLIGVGVIYSFWGHLEDSITIFIIITLLVLVEVWNEFRAKKSISALAKMAAPKTRVVREGRITEVATELIVPGDIIVLSAGTRIAADAKLLTALSVQADESSLTGESLPLAKKSGDTVSAGTLIIAGEGKAEVFATGGATEFGKIAASAQAIQPPRTPLQLAMKKLSKQLAWVAIFFSVSIPLLGVVRGQNLQDMVLTGLALAFAVIPEELPIIITMILGLGSYQLSKRHFLIKKIKATEVLGDATVILTDKTGTLTENNMQVVATYPTESAKETLAAAEALITDVSMFATDNAITQEAAKLQAKMAAGAIVRERGFGDGRKTKAVLREAGDAFTLFISGAPEEIFAIAHGSTKQFQDNLQTEANKGRRVIAVATRKIAAADKNKDFSALEKDVTVIGLISIEDAPRKGVKEALAQARTAGIRTIMVTGDHPQTALFIAGKVGIAAQKALTGDDLDKLSDKELQTAVKEVSVFSRTTPQHKYRLLQALQANGEIVAVTGDGVNDTLALKGANIGIAMGIKGTDAAKEAADVVLADDNYATIARAIFEGRKFYDNLRKGLTYYLSVKLALVVIFVLPVIIDAPFPFAPIQIILLEMFMDLAASAGFIAEPAEATIYKRSPRDVKKRFLDRSMLTSIGISGATLVVAVTVPYFYALWQSYPAEQAQTIAFAAWMIGHVLLAFVSRSENESLLTLGVFTNKVINIWAVAAVGFLLLATNVPFIGAQLKLAGISLANIAIVFAVAFVAIFWREISKTARIRKSVQGV